MLNKKQLEDASKCNIIECKDCINNTLCDNVYTFNMIKESAETALAYREALKQAREALIHILNTHNCNFKCELCPADSQLCSILQEGEIINEAIAIIDKLQEEPI